ncbi:MAG: transcriptional regulator [Gemmatimonadetes bacterium]|nr:MAG: transcriptional regulator [Gemmatimonadota bacterium]
MCAPDLQHCIAAIASLDEPVRRELYLYVAGRRREVGRDEAARALRVSRALAAFHLDKLVELGLLDAAFRRLSGRQGPGAGRPAKLYRRSTRQVDITLPQRRYDLAGRLLARALAAQRSPASRRVLERAAHDLGKTLGQEARAEARRGRGRRRPGGPGGPGGPRRPLAAALAALDDCGFEPTRVDGEVRLRNCPFDAVAAEARVLVCGMNLALVRGLVAGAGVRRARARSAPEAGACCVALTLPTK